MSYSSLLDNECSGPIVLCRIWYLCWNLTAGRRFPLFLEPADVRGRCRACHVSRGLCTYPPEKHPRFEIASAVQVVNIRIPMMD